MDWIQGEKFWTLVDCIYSPKDKPYPRDDYNKLENTFNLSQLKDSTVIYTHTMHVKMLFDIIQHLSKKFIIITHSCDYSIEDYGVIRPDGHGNVEKIDRFDLPDNVIKWYAKNVNTIHPRIESIPIGLENGIWFRKLGKRIRMLEVLTRPREIKNLVYMNHAIKTNSTERFDLYELLENKSWVTSKRSIMNGAKFDNYITNIYNHKFVISPEGNGIDTHRTWECLYMGTIPIEKRNINNQFYTDLPICFVDDWKQVTPTFLKKEYTRIKQSTWNMDKLYFEYWRKKIQIHASFMNMVHVSKDNDFGFASHQLVLSDTLKKVNKPILELGAGLHSTEMIHDISKKRGIKVLTLESDKEWLIKYEHLKTGLHDLQHGGDIKKFYAEDNEQWGLVFVDSTYNANPDPWWARKAALLKYKDTADYVVLHDCDAIVVGENEFGETIEPINSDEHDPGIRDYSKTFKYWIEFFVDGWKQWHPPTLLASNKICLDDIQKIDGMIISNRNGK